MTINVLCNDNIPKDFVNEKCVLMKMSFEVWTVLFSAEKDDDYETYGKIIAYCLVNGGPAPTFMTKFLYGLLAYGPELAEPTIEDIVDDDYKDLVRKVFSSIYKKIINIILWMYNNWWCIPCSFLALLAESKFCQIKYVYMLNVTCVVYIILISSIIQTTLNKFQANFYSFCISHVFLVKDLFLSTSLLYLLTFTTVFKPGLHFSDVTI